MGTLAPPFSVTGLLACTVSGFSVTAGEHVFALNNGGRIASGGLWRLLVKGHIVATELDFEQSDWRPNAKPMDIQGEDQIHKYLIGRSIEQAHVTVPTGDLVITFPQDVTLEFIKLHSFLESWQVLCPGLHLLVDAWGRVNQWGEPPERK